VSITLSTTDLAQIEAALTTLVSPLYYERIGDWRNASRLAVERVIGADRSAGMLPCADEPLAEHHADLLPAINDYLNYFHTLDVGLQIRRRELGLEVCHWSTVYDMKELVKSEIYNAPDSCTISTRRCRPPRCSTITKAKSPDHSASAASRCFAC
jgi:hypothetical protein